jgi:hypothetical protein
MLEIVGFQINLDLKLVEWLPQRVSRHADRKLLIFTPQKSIEAYNRMVLFVLLLGVF